MHAYNYAMEVYGDKRSEDVIIDRKSCSNNKNKKGLREVSLLEPLFKRYMPHHTARLVR